MAQSIGPYSTATEMLSALRAHTISSAELVEMHLQRIEARDGVLNAIPVRTADRARDAAKLADAAIARGVRAPLLGLPMTLKESTQAAGLPQSAGIDQLKDYKPATDGPIAASVFAAGACLLGKTNIPFACADWQADSPVYGRCNNPWDVARTPGGSTGGGAAALAAGLTPLEIGADIVGSIRVPSAYCGVYGHRPSETAIPNVGLAPLADLPNAGVVMPVQGPLARSAADLELLFDVIAGPLIGEDVGWKLVLPEARHSRLQDFRVAVMPEMPWVKASGEMLGKVDALAGFLSQRGAKVAQAMPAFDLDEYFRDYFRLLAVQTTRGMPREVREAMVGGSTVSGVLAAQYEGLTLDAADYLALLDRREVTRAKWRAFFADWDVLIGPSALGAAFEHQTGPIGERTLRVDDATVPYMMNATYPMFAIFAGQPSTSFPAGLNRAGLPLGLQAIGPYLEDRTTLRFAHLLEREWQGFVKPPGY